MKTPGKRHRFGYFAAMMVVGAAYLGGLPGAAAAQERPAGAQAPAEAAPKVRLDMLMQRPPERPPAADPFGARSWQPPAPKVKKAAAPPPPPPQAPPLPFVYMGNWLENGKTMVFLKRGDRSIVVRAGDNIDGVYGVDEVDAEKVVMTYLPLDIKQTLRFATAPATALADANQDTHEEASDEDGKN